MSEKEISDFLREFGEHLIELSENDDRIDINAHFSKESDIVPVGGFGGAPADSKVIGTISKLTVATPAEEWYIERRGGSERKRS